MDTTDIITQLAALPTFANVPQGNLAWMAAHGELRTYAEGIVALETGGTMEEMLIVLGGRVALYTMKGGGRRRLLESHTGSVLGTLPYSRIQRSPGTVFIEAEMTAFVIHRKHFPALIQECPELTAALVHYMIDRARDYQAMQLNDDRLQSLGRLASGLAHELNNPASAASRSAHALTALLDEAERAARTIAAAGMTDAQLTAIDRVRAECARPAHARGALAAADREDDIADWLTHHALDTAAAGPLAACDVSVASLDQLAHAVSPATLGVAIHWVASILAARDAARQTAAATARIHDLVSAVKGFTFMDREGVPGDVDVARGLRDTLAVLDGKSREIPVDVQLETADDLPRIHGFGSEINQIWEKLIDNAIDAAGPRGRVLVTATVRGDSIVVKVTDNGQGVPAEHRTRIFDPFFTTKPVGAGTGLGLDIVRRVVHLHHGDVDFTSQPGRTVFRVRLPVTGAMVR